MTQTQNLNTKEQQIEQPVQRFIFDSKSDKTGRSEYEIKKVVDGKKVEFELRFLAPFVFTANGYMATEQVTPTQTKITWIYNSGMNWPMNFMLLFLDMDKWIGNDVAESLGNIKRNLEK